MSLHLLGCHQLSFWSVQRFRLGSDEALPKESQRTVCSAGSAFGVCPQGDIAKAVGSLIYWHLSTKIQAIVRMVCERTLLIKQED
jgi:hypothetical protein